MAYLRWLSWRCIHVHLPHSTPCPRGTVGSWFANRGAMDEIFQCFDTEVTGLLRQHKTNGIHQVGFAFSIWDDILGNKFEPDTGPHMIFF